MRETHWARIRRKLGLLESPCRSRMNFADGPRAAALSAIDLPIFRRVVGVLTEQEVLRSWRKLFKGGEHDESSLNLRRGTAGRVACRKPITPPLDDGTRRASQVAKSLTPSSTALEPGPVRRKLAG